MRVLYNNLEKSNINILENKILNKVEVYYDELLFYVSEKEVYKLGNNKKIRGRNKIFISTISSYLSKLENIPITKAAEIVSTEKPDFFADERVKENNIDKTWTYYHLETCKDYIDITFLSRIRKKIYYSEKADFYKVIDDEKNNFIEIKNCNFCPYRNYIMHHILDDSKTKTNVKIFNSATCLHDKLKDKIVLEKILKKDSILKNENFPDWCPLDII